MIDYLIYGFAVMGVLFAVLLIIASICASFKKEDTPVVSSIWDLDKHIFHQGSVYVIDGGKCYAIKEWAKMRGLQADDANLFRSNLYFHGLKQVRENDEVFEWYRLKGANE